jgi:hypothetical protein
MQNTTTWAMLAAALQIPLAPVAAAVQARPAKRQGLQRRGAAVMDTNVKLQAKRFIMQAAEQGSGRNMT